MTSRASPARCNPTPKGYRVELRVPLSMIGRALRRVDRRSRRARRGPRQLRHSAQRRSAHGRPPDRVRRRSSRAISRNSCSRDCAWPWPRRNRTPAGAGRRPGAGHGASDRQRGILARFYRRFVDRPGDRRSSSPRPPIYDRDHQQSSAHCEARRPRIAGSCLRDRRSDPHAEFHADHERGGGHRHVRLRRVARRPALAAATRRANPR